MYWCSGCMLSDMTRRPVYIQVWFSQKFTTTSWCVAMKHENLLANFIMWVYLMCTHVHNHMIHVTYICSTFFFSVDCTKILFITLLNLTRVFLQGWETKNLWCKHQKPCKTMLCDLNSWSKNVWNPHISR